MKGGMKDFKSFEEALVTPAVSVGTSSAYNGLPFVNAVSFGTNGGYVQKYSKYSFFKGIKLRYFFKSFDI